MRLFGEGNGSGMSQSFVVREVTRERRTAGGSWNVLWARRVQVVAGPYSRGAAKAKIGGKRTNRMRKEERRDEKTVSPP